ncbi:MAG: energy-coupling factor transporter transmembrane component T family protein [Marmoricola sp.]
MLTLGLYRPGSSVLHRLPAGAKLALLVLAGAGSVFVRHPWQVGAALAGVVCLYLLAGLSPRVLWAQLRPLWWMVLLLGGFHVLVNGWARAAVVVGVLLGLVLLAALVTLTTRTTAMVEAVVRVLAPLRVVGVDPERIGLLLSLGIRSVPVVAGLAAQVREAQLARGRGTSPRAFAVPLVVRSLRHADALGEALAARGLDD